MLGVRKHLTFVFLRGLTGLALLCLVSGCTQQAARSTSSSSSSKSGSSSTVNGTSCSATFESDCSVFRSNTADYALCGSCRLALCPTNGCCSVTVNQLAGCVHSNTSTAGGSCIGLQCGQGQIADLTSCTCRDGSPSSTAGAPPGYEDTLTPSLQVGLAIGNRYCPLPQGSSSVTDVSGSDPKPWDCFTNATGGPSLTTPAFTTQPAANVFTDVGYVRWDLGLDASQVPMIDFYLHHYPFLGSQSTLAGTFNFSYQLKPNTQVCPATVGGAVDCSLSSSTYNIAWRDCVEHFSGYFEGSIDTLTAPTNCSSSIIPQIVNMGLAGSAPNANTLTLLNGPVSLNGPAATLVLTKASSTHNPALALGVGIGKTDNASDFTGFQNVNSGLFSNVGYYKYTWGSLNVRRPNTLVDVASTSVTGQVAINTNLGYEPISVVDSTAFSNEALNGEEVSKLCLETANRACVVTGVYRSIGGGVLSQNFSPAYPNHASPVSTLPSGITSAGTPRIIEDKSQIDATSATSPPSLRVFTRATDGNIYMSKGKLGVWGNWVSLGRPWLGTDDTSTAPLSNYVSAGKAPVYWPYMRHDPAANLPVNPYSGTVHEGISIVGEPVVAAYNDTTVTPFRTYLAVFVRVSHFNCTAANTCSLGTFHNSVFWTYSIANSTGTAASFDNIQNWSPWTPVYDGTGYFKIQGSPLAFFKRPSTGTAAIDRITVYLVGTLQTNLHPPVGPRNTVALDYTTTAGTRWFNYGDTMIRTSYQFEFADNGALIDTPAEVPDVMDADFATNPNMLTWNAIETDSPADRIFVSDWSLSSPNVDPDFLWDNGAGEGAKIYAYALFDNGFSLNSAPGMPLTEYASYDPDGSVTQSPFINTRRLYTYSIQPVNGSVGGTSGLSLVGGAGNVVSLHNETTRHLWGTPHPVTVSSGANFADSWWPDADNDGATLLFSRATCPEEISCDHVNPTVAYVGLNPLTSAAGNRTIYFSGDGKRQGGTLSGVARLLPFYSTSDIIPIFSSGLTADNDDVSVYLFMRNIQGKISVGKWGTKNRGAAGVPLFQFVTPGALTN